MHTYADAVFPSATNTKSSCESYEIVQGVQGYGSVRSESLR